MRLRLFQIVQRAQDNDKVSRWYDYFIVLVAFVSIVPLMFKPDQISPEMDLFLNGLDIITVFILFADYVFRWLTFDIRSGWGKKAFFLYPFTPMAIFDLLAILPSITILHDGLKFLRILRIVRILRMFRGLAIMTNVFIRERKALLSIVFFMWVYVFAVGIIMFTVEPETFETFLDALYWSTTSLATIGYGDITPVTELGKGLAILSSLIGIAIVAFPAGIITGGYINQLKSAKKKGVNYFSLPVKHDKIFKGKPITSYKSISHYIKSNKKVFYYTIWIAIGVVISVSTTSVCEIMFPQSIINFDEYGSIIIAVILEPSAGIFVGLINDILFAIYSHTASAILTFACTAMYAIVFGIYFRRGKDITIKSILMAFLVCVIFNTVYYIILYIIIDPTTLLDTDTYDSILDLAVDLGVDVQVAVLLWYLIRRFIYAAISIATCLLIRKFLWGSKIDPMMKIPVSKRFRMKIYKKKKNEHNYIQQWIEDNSEEDDDLSDFESVVEQGKRSIERSRRSLDKQKQVIQDMQNEIAEKTKKLNSLQEDLAKKEEVIDQKKRAVKRVKRKQKYDESDSIIPNIVSSIDIATSGIEITSSETDDDNENSKK